MKKLCHGFLLASLSVPAWAQNYDTRLAATSLWDLPLETLMAIPVSTLASGTETPANKTAATVTVITAEDMAAAGVTDIDEALSRVPGLYIQHSDQDYFSKYIIRGISSVYNAETLVMVNGIPIKNLFVGNRSLFENGMLAKNVARIEVIRGPGSALYGADAFGGVINIITKSATDITENTASVRTGSFELIGATLQQSFNWGGWKTAFIAEREQRGTTDKIIKSDLVSLYDPSASQAPGPLNDRYERNDLRLDMQKEAWQFRVGYRRLDKVGNTVGTIEALTNSSLYASDRLTMDLNYAQDNWLPELDLKTTLSYYHNSQANQQDNLLLPAGAKTLNPYSTATFPNGMIGNPNYHEDQARFDSHLAWNGWQNHIVRFGTGFFWGDIYRVTELKNFDVAALPTAQGLIDVSDTDNVFLHENQRTNYYAYAQDEWRLQPQTVLTTGLRFDEYSDFGHAVNPRLALVKAWTPTMTSRLLYGRAFHAPSFVDLYATNNPAALGNPSLQPEILDNWELGWSHQPFQRFSYNLSGFHYRIHDQIINIQGKADNGGGQQGWGGELEWQAQLNAGWRLNGSYSHQHGTTTDTHVDTGIAPENLAAIQIYWQPSQQPWQQFLEWQWSGHQQRPASDPRLAMHGYSTVNWTWQYPQIWKRLDLMLKVRNLFNDDIRNASRTPSITYDYPLAGRNITAEVTWHWADH